MLSKYQMIPKGNDIANELQELIPGAQWPQKAPLSGVPAGYFETLPAIILAKVHQVEVQEELESLSFMLAAVPKAFPLTVPPGYFDQLPSGIITRIQDVQEPELLGISQELPFTAPPAGYFEQLPQQILARIHEEQESELKGISRELPFSTPAAGYFDQLPQQIFARIHEEQELKGISRISPLTPPPSEYFRQLSSLVMQRIMEETDTESVSPFAELTKTAPFSMAEGYFEQLPDQIMQKVRSEEVADELADISPLLAGAPKTMPFSVPTGYFNQLDTQIAAIAQQPAKVVNMRPRRMQLYKWAAAACMIALVGTSSLYYLRNTQHSSGTATTINLAEASLSDVSDQEILEYLQNHVDAFDKDDLMGLTAGTPKTTTTETSPLPGGLSTEDIESYLENTGSLKEESPITN